MGGGTGFDLNKKNKTSPTASARTLIKAIIFQRKRFIRAAG